MFRTVIASVALMAAAPAAAAVVVDAGPAGETYESGWSNAYFNLSTPGTPGQRFAVRFTLDQQTTLAGMTIFTNALFAHVGDQTVVDIFADNAGQIGSEIYFGGFGISQVSATPYTVDSGGIVGARTDFTPVTLAAGTYWISLSGYTQELGWQSFREDGDPLVRFDQEDVRLGLAGTGIYRLPYLLHDDGDPVGAFDPGTIYNPPSGVPEPASWAMLLLGFGALGATMRARPSRIDYAPRR